MPIDGVCAVNSEIVSDNKVVFAREAMFRCPMEEIFVDSYVESKREIRQCGIE